MQVILGNGDWAKKASFSSGYLQPHHICLFSFSAPAMGPRLYIQFPIFRDTIYNLVAQYKTLSGVDVIQDHNHPVSMEHPLGDAESPSSLLKPRNGKRRPAEKVTKVKIPPLPFFPSFNSPVPRKNQTRTKASRTEDVSICVRDMPEASLAPVKVTVPATVPRLSVKWKWWSCLVRDKIAGKTQFSNHRRLFKTTSLRIFVRRPSLPPERSVCLHFYAFFYAYMGFFWVILSNGI